MSVKTMEIRKRRDGSLHQNRFALQRFFSETNTGLYDDDAVYDISLIFEDDRSVDDSEISQDTTVDTTEFSILSKMDSPKIIQNMASINSPILNKPVNENELTVIPTNADIMKCLNSINSRLSNIEGQLKKIDILEKKVDNFENDMKKLCCLVHESRQQTDERLNKIEERVESTDFSQGVVNENQIDLEKERDSLKNDVTYLQSQSMRNNLIFGNIEESATRVFEDSEEIIRQFLHDKMKIAKDLVESTNFEQVHRIGQRSDRKRRTIVAKFASFKDREYVRKQWKTLQGTKFFCD